MMRRFGRTVTSVMLVATIALGGAPSASAKIMASDRVAGKPPADAGLPMQAMPDVAMKAGVLISSDGRVLWERNAGQKRAMASITKIMTAVVALEQSSGDDMVTVSTNALSIGESTSFLRRGESLPMRELLEALVVKSGNDAAITVAEHVAGSESAFVDLMNAKAAELGLENTRFKNSHGLDADGHFSTASDLGVLSRYAMGKPEFRRLAGMKTVTIGAGKRKETLQSTNLMLGNYDGANGVKTGFTSDAGYSVVESAQRDGVELYAVVLGCTSEMQRFKDARELLDWGFAHYRMRELASAGTIIGESQVTDYLDVVVPVAISQDASQAVFDVDGEITRAVTVTAVRAPVAKGQRLGVATFTQGGRLVASVPLVATRDVPAPTLWERLGIGVMRFWRKLTGSSSAETAAANLLRPAAVGVS